MDRSGFWMLRKTLASTLTILSLVLVPADDAASQGRQQIHIQSVVAQVRINDFDHLGVDFGAQFAGLTLAERQARIQATIGTTFRGVAGAGNQNLTTEFHLDLMTTPAPSTEDEVRVLLRPRVAPYAIAGLGFERQTFSSGTFSDSRVEPVLTLGAGASVVVGGLSRGSASSESQVPILGNVAIVQHFYDGGNETVVRAGLQVFISPTIVRDPEN